MIEKLYKHYPWIINDLRECRHNKFDRIPNPYHLEGDVWSHTMLVYQQAETDFEQALALCHDIGKIHTQHFSVQTGRTSFFGHSGVSAFISIGILQTLGLTEKELIDAFKLISTHMEIHQISYENLLKKYPKDWDFIKKSRKFAKMDTKGRITAINDKFDFLEYNTQDLYLKDELRIDPKPDKTVTMMVGLPCSGKSSYAELEPSTDILSRDTYVMMLGNGIKYDKCWESCNQKKVDEALQWRKKELIKTSNNVIIDMTNLSLKGRRRMLNGFEKWNKKAVVFLTSWEDIKKRNDSRFGKYIDKKVYLKMMKSFCLPSFKEFNEIEWKIT